MGFYTPATIVKDAQRHDLKIKPVCVSQSDWRCTVVNDNTLRLGFCVVSGLRQDRAEELVRQRADRQFESLDDFKRRVPLSKEESRSLAELGALNCFSGHRRAALWEVEEVYYDDLLGRDVVEALVPSACFSSSGLDTSTTTARDDLPLAPMMLPERVRADYDTMNLTTGPHLMKLLRESFPNVWSAIDLKQAPHGATIQIAGNVICRQRPGTAKGFVFISLEDETGVANAIVDPNLFERFRLVITEETFLLIEGDVQNSDGVVLIKSRELKPLTLTHEKLIGSGSHDFR
jgi:error-prone DNA polymerase